MVDMDMAVDMDMVDIVTSVRDLLMPSLPPLLMLMLMPTTDMVVTMAVGTDMVDMDMAVDMDMVDIVTSVRDLLTLMPKLLLLLMRMLMLTTVMDTDVDTMVDITAVVMEDTVTAEDTTGDK